MDQNTCRNNAHIYREILKNTAFSVPDNIHLPYSENFSLLSKTYSIKNKTIHNRICYQPMEAQDADIYGNPTERTVDRYIDLARGGAGIIWLEAVSVVSEGRSNKHQLMITNKNVDSYMRLLEGIKSECIKHNGFEPCVIIQLNHSGRHSKPNGIPEPLVASDIDVIDIYKNAENIILSDEYLEKLPHIFAERSLLCEKAGFDGIDIKCCHGYLFSELLSCNNRPGKYGTTLDGRSKILIDTMNAVNEILNTSTIRASRLGIYDGYNSIHSFGTNINDYEQYDLSEPKKLIHNLITCGLDLLNVTMGSPYINPDVSRPYQNGIDKPKSNALCALSRLFNGADEIHKAFPHLPIVNTGVSGLGERSPFAAAGMIDEDMTDFVGFGRMSFAYPEIARDIVNNNFQPNKSCVACSGCSTLKKNGLESGCIIRNDYYKKIFKEYKNR